MLFLFSWQIDNHNIVKFFLTLDNYNVVSFSLQTDNHNNANEDNSKTINNLK